MLKETKEYLLSVVRTAALHKHPFFSKMIYILSDYCEWNGEDAVSRDFGIPVSALKTVLPKQTKKENHKKKKKEPEIQVEL